MAAEISQPKTTDFQTASIPSANKHQRGRSHGKMSHHPILPIFPKGSPPFITFILHTVAWPLDAARRWAEDENPRKGSYCKTLGYPFSLCIYKEERSRNYLKSFPYGFTCPTDSKESWPALTAMTPIRQELNVSCHHQSSHSHSQRGYRLKDSYRLSLSLNKTATVDPGGCISMKNNHSFGFSVSLVKIQKKKKSRLMTF